MAERAQITVKGIVQGVGFRPYVYTLASSLGLKGCVRNAEDGVSIDIEGEAVADFIARLAKQAPALSRITEVIISVLPPYGYKEFKIIQSRDDNPLREGIAPFTLTSPDVSICEDCLRELFDPSNRRYLYPFINCTNCGPRYTITKSIPYDRANTTMSAFKMCPECMEEYENPNDRRFHAEPNACPACGPHVELKGIASPAGNGIASPAKNKDPIGAVARLIKEGHIVAIKGLGGFHIACDATNESALRRLREKKRKSNKPFALMAGDIETIERFSEVSEQEKALLLSPKRPIVLLRKRGSASGEKGGNASLPEAVSPNNQYLGFMLPYTPLHYLLFRQGALPAPLVMTSGNISEEPIATANDEAIQKLSDIADAFLVHNRDIFMRSDDSVVRVILEEEESFIRRSRGYVPSPIALDEEGPEVLGSGGDLKNTFTLTKGRFLIPSQHIGDMENYETLRFFEESLKNLKAVYRVKPSALAYDMHPGYLVTQWASRQEGILKIPLQHHYAHIGSVMAEHGIRNKVIGVAFDGTGYGMDGNLWGGEFLIADINGFKRAGQFKYTPLPGGEKAIKEPWRMAVSYIHYASGDKTWDCLEQIGFIERHEMDNIERLMKVMNSRELSALSSGAGRLFDAVSSIIGICHINTFEGEAAMALEAITVEGIDDDYPVEIDRGKDGIVIDFSPAINRIIDDIKNKVSRHAIASKFHNTISSVIVRVVGSISNEHDIRDVALSGGTFQNMYLLKKTMGMLISSGMNVFINKHVPSNDGGISLGQAYLIRERLRD